MFPTPHEIDTAPGSVFGLRGWTVYDGKLRSAFEYTWPAPARKQISTCPYVCLFTPGNMGCGCGFWAYWGYTAYVRNKEVVGVFEGSGRTRIGSKGFRSHYGRIVALLNGDGHPVSRRVLTQYEVPIYRSISDMIRHHPLTREYSRLSPEEGALDPVNAPLRIKWRPRWWRNR